MDGVSWAALPQDQNKNWVSGKILDLRRFLQNKNELKFLLNSITE